jgi:glycoprotein endo-alpha-1,2-mannosidase
MLWRLAVFLCSCLTAFSGTSNSFFEFVQEQSERRYTNVPHEVLASYYVWYGPGKSWGKEDVAKKEISNTARYPIKGAYDSHDPAVIDWHIDQAKAQGITGFIASWWGVGEHESWVEKGCQILIERAEKKNFKIAIYWEQAPGEGKDQIQRAIGELSYVLTRYGKSPAFLKVDGKPVIFAYGRVMWQIPPNAWPEIIRATRTKAGDFALIADGDQKNYAYLFDGLHTYPVPSGEKFAQLPAKTERPHEEAVALAARAYEEAVGFARQHQRIACVTVSPGYDDRKHNKPGFQVDRHDGHPYEALWKEAVKVNPDWILITSWNEWPEGTEIEPSVELGDKYLKITSQYAKSFIKETSVADSGSARPPALTLSMRKIDELLAGRNAAVLAQDRLNDAEFWVAYCGASMKRLTWANLIDPSQFNAKTFPLTVILRRENFTGTIKKAGDVKQAFIKYLHEGGFLVVLPLQPWPLHYDDSLGGQPHAITDDLALGVNSWPGFPAPTELTFSLNTNALAGLPAKVPFLTTGDLRWTGASRSRVPKYDTYVPLVQLRDTQNHYFGEGAVYIEHRTLPISPGKTIYVWMRTAETIGEDKFYPALFEFISTKLKPIQK